MRDAALMNSGKRDAADGPELLRFIDTYRRSLGVHVNPL